MSQPPPLPSDAPFAETVEMAYAMPGTAVADLSSTRPGILTALGVSSIVVAVLQGGTAIIVCFMAFSLWIVSVIPPTRPHLATVAESSFPDGLPMHLAAPLTNRMAEQLKLSPARKQSLDALLRHSGRDVAPTMTSATNINDAAVKRLVLSHARTSDGNDLILLPTGRVELSDAEATFEPDGTTDVVSVETAKMGLNAIVPSETPLPTPTTKPQVKITSAELALWYGTSIAAGLLSVVLMIAGILTLRGRKAGRTAHLWWAWLKLPIAIAGAAGIAWMLIKFAEVGATQNGTTPSPARGGVAVFGVIQGALSVAYIIAVIVVMYLKHVRDFFASR